MAENVEVVSEPQEEPAKVLPDATGEGGPKALTREEEARRNALNGYARVKAEFLLTREEVKANLPEKTPDAKLHGMNLKRPKDKYEDKKDSVCNRMAVYNECTFGDSCKFSHDVMAYMARKEPDIKTPCPIWDVRGFCPAGLNCCFGSSHIDAANGKNILRSDEEGGVLPDLTMNILAQEVFQLGRKNKLTYKCEAKAFKQYLQKLAEDDDKAKLTESQKEQLRQQLEEKQMKKRKREETEGPVGGATAEDAPAEAKDVKMEEAKVIEPAAAVPVPEHITWVIPDEERLKVNFEGKVYVAPLTTVGNLPFRRCMKDFGADITCGEMALCQPLLKCQPSEWALLKRHPSEDVFGIQIAGAHADQMTRLAEMLNDNTTSDFVDLNLGCPIDLVCNQGMGAALMTRQRKLRGILQGMSSILRRPLTVKMRIGWDEKKPSAHNLIPTLQSYAGKGVAAIMVHGRSRLQRYSKLADWEYVRKCAASQDASIPRIPIIGNGDIMSFTDHERNMENRVEGMSTCAMIGRGALIKPWLPTEIKERRHWDISASERLDIYKTYVNYGLEHWGSDKLGVNRTRRFLLEWLNFTCRYVPAGLLEVLPQNMNERPPAYYGRSDLETLLSSQNASDWVKISEMFLGPVPENFKFEPKHRSNSYAPTAGKAALNALKEPEEVEG